MSNNKKSFDTVLLFRIYKLAAPYRFLFVFAVLCTLILAIINPYRAWLTQKVIDNSIAKGNMHELNIFFWVMLFLLVFQALITVGQALTAGYIGQQVIKKMRVRVYDYILSYQFKKLDKTPVGTLVTRSVSDLETLAEIFSEGLVSITGDILQLVFILALMFFTHWKLTLVTLSILPALLYAGYIFKNAVKTSFTDTRNQVTKLNTFVQEHIQGMQVVQIFNRQKKEFEKFREINIHHRDAHNRAVFAYAVFFPVVELITALSTALLVWYGVGRIIDPSSGITFGILTSFLMLTNNFFRPIRQLADKFNTLQMGMVAGERIFALLDENEAPENLGQQEIPLHSGVEFINVKFSYHDSEPVLHRFSFKLPPGKSLAIVGHTGAGKTSVVNLLTRFYNYQGGEILFGDKKIENIPLQLLRQSIVVVQQDVFLFTGSVYENLCLFDSQIPRDKVYEATRKLGIHDMILSWQNGYDTYIHERGITLSAGQRQLIALTRALIANPKVLILDEATANIDTQSEKMIQNAIHELMQGRTSIAIAHRLSTIREADEIIVMDKGEIAETGTHDELLSLDGIYTSLCKKQFYNWIEE